MLAACGGSDSTTADPATSDVATETAAPTDPADDFTESNADGDSDGASSEAGADADAGATSDSDSDADPAADVDSDADVDTDGDLETPEGDVDADADPDEENDPLEEDDPLVADDPDEEGDEVGNAAAGAQTATLSEWMIDAPTDYVAGEITFTAVNDGGFPHEFVVIEGESYESLPLAEGGAVLEDELPTGALIGRTAKLPGGSSEDLTVDLPAGTYVLVCNLGGGDNSHAGQGQRLNITVS